METLISNLESLLTNNNENENLAAAKCYLLFECQRLESVFARMYVCAWVCTYTKVKLPTVRFVCTYVCTTWLARKFRFPIETRLKCVFIIMVVYGTKLHVCMRAYVILNIFVTAPSCVLCFAFCFESSKSCAFNA